MGLVEKVRKTEEEGAVKVEVEVMFSSVFVLCGGVNK